jgi:ureidoglycolate hydrolase
VQIRAIVQIEGNTEREGNRGKVNRYLAVKRLREEVAEALI